MSANLPITWRRWADELDAYARVCRRSGDTHAAQDAEQAATDYRVAADELEAERAAASEVSS